MILVPQNISSFLITLRAVSFFSYSVRRETANVSTVVWMMRIAVQLIDQRWRGRKNVFFLSALLLFFPRFSPDLPNSFWSLLFPSLIGFQNKNQLLTVCKPMESPWGYNWIKFNIISEVLKRLPTWAETAVQNLLLLSFKNNVMLHKMWYVNYSN